MAGCRDGAACVRLHGKGRKDRSVALWKSTAAVQFTDAISINAGPSPSPRWLLSIRYRSSANRRQFRTSRCHSAWKSLFVVKLHLLNVIVGGIVVDVPPCEVDRFRLVPEHSGQRRERHDADLPHP